MKNSWEWDENDLRELVKNAAKEAIDLDFKQSDALHNTDGKKNEISKDVSALANSAGGTLVYGIVEDKYVAKSLDKGSDPKVITKEWLEQVINSRIHQRIDGIRINQIDLKTTNSGNVAYVVYVPASMRAPHQASDKRFYKRFNFESVPMEEYEIRDVMRRSETPDLRIEFLLPNPEITENKETQELQPFQLLATVTNDAIEPAEYAVINIFIDARIIVENPSGLTHHTDAFLQLGDGNSHHIHMLSINWNVPSKMPLFKDAIYRISEPFSLKIHKDHRWQEKAYLLGYEIKAPKMQTKQLFTTLQLKNSSLSLSKDFFGGLETLTRIK